MNNMNEMLATPASQATKEAWLRAIAIQLAQMNDTMAALFFALTHEELGDEQEIVVELEEPLVTEVVEETVVKPKKSKAEPKPKPSEV